MITPSLFDERGLAEITHPGLSRRAAHRLLQPFMAEERARKREELLATHREGAAKVAEACERPRKPLEGKAEIGLKAGAVLARFKMGKYFSIRIGECGLSWHRKPELLGQGSRHGRDLRDPDLGAQRPVSDQEAVLTYKRLAKVERAFRTMKSVDLQVRPIYHHLERAGEGPPVHLHAGLLRGVPSAPSLAGAALPR